MFESQTFQELSETPFLVYIIKTSKPRLINPHIPSLSQYHHGNKVRHQSSET